VALLWDETVESLRSYSGAAPQQDVPV